MPFEDLFSALQLATSRLHDGLLREEEVCTLSSNPHVKPAAINGLSQIFRLLGTETLSLLEFSAGAFCLQHTSQSRLYQDLLSQSYTLMTGS